MIETVLTIGGEPQPVTLVWPAEKALRMSLGLEGVLGDRAYTACWRYVIAQLERARHIGLSDGETMCLDVPPPV